MNESYNLNSNMAVRRSTRRMPSLWRHMLQALAFIVIAASLVAVYLFAFGNPKDAIAVGSVALEPVPMQTHDPLEASQPVLPDLLEGDVPKGVNPTQMVDALGNVIIEPGLAGREATPEVASNVPVYSGGQPIMIDGEPVGGPVGQTYISLPPAPLAGLTRQSPFGKVPAIAPDGRRSVTAYARPFTPTAGKDTVSIIIGGLGIDRNLTGRVINDLPPEVTLSFAAHANGLQTWINQARSRGHEVLIELPMDSATFNPSEPGADHALLANQSAAQNIKNLDWLMSRAAGYFAVTNYNGDTIVGRTDIMAPILTHLANSGVGFIYDGATDAPSLTTLASSTNLPMLQAYNLIDTAPQKAAINSQLSRLEDQAGQGTTPIGIGFALPETYSAVNAWVRSLEAKNMQLAPASYALNHR